MTRRPFDPTVALACVMFPHEAFFAHLANSELARSQIDGANTHDWLKLEDRPTTSTAASEGPAIMHKPLESPEEKHGRREGVRGLVDGFVSAIPFVGGTLATWGRAFVPSAKDKATVKWRDDVTSGHNETTEKIDVLSKDQSRTRETVAAHDRDLVEMRGGFARRRSPTTIMRSSSTTTVRLSTTESRRLHFGFSRVSMVPSDRIHESNRRSSHGRRR